ncbi:MAG: PL29 family lyase N-terminal domain-containing protein [Candidatus Cryptobacteroides sp.]
MKKSLIMILGAAVLFAGCAKDLTPEVNDLKNQLEQLQQQVEANKKAIEALQAAEFITDVQQTEAGWSITLSNGDVITLYNGKDGAAGTPGKDGQDGDAFFASVEVKEDVVVFTLVNGDKFEVPYAVDFAIVFEKRDLIVEPNTTVKVPFTITGRTPETEVYVLAGGTYTASLDGDAVVINTPETIVENSILVFADNGHGKTSVRSLNLDKYICEVTTTDLAAYFWGGSLSFPITTNVGVTVESKADWIKVVEVKAATTKTANLSYTPTPRSYPRTGEVVVKDEFGVTVQTITVTQAGTALCMVGNKSYNSLAEAIAGAPDLEDVKNSGVVDIAISETAAPIEELIAIPESSDLKWVIRVRSIGGGKAENCVIRGIDVRNTELEVHDVTIEPAEAITKGVRPLAKDGETYGVGYFPHPYGVCVETESAKPVTLKNVIFNVTDELVAYVDATLLYVCPSTGLVTLDACQLNGRGSRISQIYGGNVTFNSCSIIDSYSSYAVRVGNSGNNIILTNNLVDSPVFVDVHSSCKAPSTITVGDGTVDNNHYSANVTTKVKGLPAAEGVVVNVGAAQEATVDMDGVLFTTVQSALDLAQDGSVITLGEQEYAENVKVNKNVTIVGKNRETSVIAGNIEIASGVTIKNLTIKEKSGVTDNNVAIDASGIYNWGHKFLCRIEYGAKGVLIEDVNLVADDATAADDFKNSVSTIWISQAEDVTVRNCKITTTADGAYCPNQTYEGQNVVFEGNEFIGGGKKGWGIRVAATTTATVRNNTFHTTYGVDVLNTFKGTLILGNGVVDDNNYGSEIERAVNGDKDAQIALGAQFFPADMMFNEKTTSEPFVKAWSASINGLGIGDSRCFTSIGNTVICGVTVTPMVAVKDGAITDTYAFDFAEAVGFTGKITGVTTINNNGKQEVLAGNVAALGNQWAPTSLVIQVYHYTSPTEVEQVVNWQMAENADDPNLERAGDYLSFRGTWQDGEILICAANATGKYVYSFPVKDGVVAKEPVKIPIGADVQAVKNGTAGIYHYKDDVYVITSEGAAPAVVKRTESGFSLLGQMDLSKFALVTAGATRTIRTPQFITIGETEYMVFFEGEYASSNCNGGKVCVLPLKGADLLESLTNYSIEDVYQLAVVNDEGKTAGNGFASVGATVNGGVCQIGYGLRNGEIGVVVFRP